ncbi:hypothetical protein YTPLAS18_25380 [Nitrospira sp.]|nr:hypothetical protein YTPLAS18_25380 [Nitrospira sp.]
MRLGIEATPILGDRGGVGWYLYFLLRAFAQLDDEYELYCYVDPGYRERMTWEPWMDDPRLQWREATRTSMRWRGASDRLDLFHGPNFRLRTLGRYGGVVTIHDLWMDRHPEYSPKLFPNQSSKNTRRTAWQARRVITDSYASAREINELYGLPMDRIVVVHCGISEDFSPRIHAADMEGLRHRLGLGDQGYVLFVGGADPRKNHGLLLEAAAAVRQELKGRKLVLIGDAVHRHGNYYETAAKLGLTDLVVCPGRVPMDELRLLYTYADVFAFPSLYEGFGMPVLEAMACGAPVITSNRSSLLEVAGDAAILVDPEQSVQLGAAMVRLLNDSSLRDRLRQRGFARVARFSWSTAARQVMSVYREVCRSPLATRRTNLVRERPVLGTSAQGAVVSAPVQGKGRLSRPIQRALVIKLRYVGDVLLATAVPRAVKLAFPGVHMTMAVMRGTEAVLNGNPYVDDVLIVDRSTFWTQAAFFDEIRRRQFDCVIDLTGNDRSELACLISRAPVRVGFHDARRWRGRLAYTHEHDPPAQLVHRIDRDLGLLKTIGISSPVEWPRLYLSQEEEEAAERILRESKLDPIERPLVMLHPGARYWFKTWPPERFARLADCLTDSLGCAVIIGGGAAEQPIGRAIDQMAHGPIVNLVGTIKLREYAALVKRCAVFIGNDNGAMHIAAAVGTPVIGLFGPSDPAEWAPRGTRSVICYKGVDCRQCFHPTCRRGEDNCMRQISVDEVLEAVRRVLGDVVDFKEAVGRS